jgi:hypothetical protein|tara:strand:- start:2296 stop:2493 length:198 start_codon:yes stop_codon:yes gene_type:complete
MIGKSNGKGPGVAGVSDFSKGIRTGNPVHAAHILREAGMLKDPNRPHSTNEDERLERVVNVTLSV